MDVVSEHLRRCFSPCLPSHTTTTSSGEVKHHHGKIITSDPYVAVTVPQTTLARTRVIKNSQNPIWNEHFKIPLAHPVWNLEFLVKDNDVFGAQLIGKVMIPAKRIATEEVISGWFKIEGPNAKPDSEIELEMRFVWCERNELYRNGIASGKSGVRDTYFPLRRGCAETLYQDAHVRDEDGLPGIELEGGRVYRQEKCWEDICYAISEAHHLIYVVGWSIYHKVRLVREPTRELPRGGDLTLGELLKYKSEEGVRVLMLVWDDKTSHSKYFINLEGVMQTHDEDTRRFFKHSSVICVLSPRYASSKLSYIKQQVIGTLFTHHQKCVLVDTHAHGNFRKISAFLGGIDLCDGRYDTPDHRLFRDLDMVFKDDFHNPTFPAGTKAPRQPWHDLHCKIEGPAAYDVLTNFEQRWRKATRWKQFGLGRSISRWHDALIKLDRISWILSPSISVEEGDGMAPGDDPKLMVSEEDNPETWHVQVFRSIDSGSVKGFPRTVAAAESRNLICSKNLVIDSSIQTAYIQAIRSAQNFIYIENQYFIGSSYAWPSYKDAGADNLIPMELALKIASKIRARERFAVYIVIPMWPEGDPKSAAVQEILFWQGQTMEMMYGIVARELQSMQLTDSHPEDYLNFYCLGKREDIPDEISAEDDRSASNGVAANKVSDSYKNRRFMIYVHAKGMVVDDEYVIVGSANFNQRSLAGTKDTEIAMGAYQPHHSWAEKRKHPRGQVYGYRMSLWAEHLGGLEERFKEPSSLQTVGRVNEVARDNWRRYTDEKFTLLQGHLIKYPLQIDSVGKVSPLPNQETFPDIGGKILGAYSPTLPDTLTT
ncbi:hypothetical protein Drorol1_Dr00005210 [Drosera rotundifolia]